MTAVLTPTATARSHRGRLGEGIGLSFPIADAGSDIAACLDWRDGSAHSDDDLARRNADRVRGDGIGAAAGVRVRLARPPRTQLGVARRTVLLRSARRRSHAHPVRQARLRPVRTDATGGDPVPAVLDVAGTRCAAGGDHRYPGGTLR